MCAAGGKAGRGAYKKNTSGLLCCRITEKTNTSIKAAKDKLWQKLYLKIQTMCLQNAYMNIAGEDIGDLLTLLCVEVSSENTSMNAVFFSTRVIEQRELSVIEHAVTRAAGGLDITCEVHF